MFYDIMWYPVPAQALYFSYGDSWDIPRNNEQILSFDTFTFTEQQKKTLYAFSIFCKNILFIEWVYFHNDITFEPQNTTIIELIVVTSYKRLRTSYFSYHLLLIIFLVRKKIHKIDNCIITTNVWVDEQKTNFISHMASAQDIFTLYWLAHLSPLYIAYEWKNNIYENNWRIEQYLPLFPKQYVINLWWQYQTGISPIRKWLENIFSWYIVDYLELFAKNIGMIILLILKKLGKLYKDSIIAEDNIRYMKDRRITISILWKMFNKDV